MTKHIRLIICLLLFVVGVNTVSGQIDIEEDSTLWLDSELYEESKEAPPYSWIGGGFSVGYFMPNLTSFNTNIAQKFVGTEVKDQVLLFGGQGFIPFPYAKNIRIGGMGYGGATEQCCVPDTTDVGQPVTRSLRYSIGYGGLMLDYALPLKTGRFRILVGTELGLGGIDIEAKQAANRTRFDINEDFDNASTNITHTYSSSFFLYKPRVTFEFAPANFLMFHLAVGYQGTAMGDWKVDGDVELGDTTGLDDINGNGLIINFGINLGFFQ